jgi:hypothetical protein
VAPDDLVIELEPKGEGETAKVWGFSQRSTLIYQGKQAAKKALPGWLARLGWSK